LSFRKALSTFSFGLSVPGNYVSKAEKLIDKYTANQIINILQYPF